MLYAKINVKSNHFLFLTSLESPLNKGGSEGVWKYRWLPTFPAHDLLQRLFNEQYVVMDGKAVLRDKKEVKADSLQNPNDPDATYRAKNDQKVLGYVTNITETVEEGKPNIITSVQVETAVFADCHLLQEAVEATGNTYEAVKAVTKQDAGKR